MDEKAEVCLFLGYVAHSKRYKVFNLNIEKVVICRDLIVDKAISWDWEEEKVVNGSMSSISDSLEVRFEKDL